jgi:hypothetical protein
MVDTEPNSDHHVELTSLKGVPFVVSNTTRPGAFEEHLVASDGNEWSYTETLSESSYPAVRE